MTDAWDVLNKALHGVWNDLLTTALCNLLWLFFSLLIITAPPATLALFYVGNRLAHGEPTDAGDFLRGLRRYFGLGWRWGLLHGSLLFFLLGDVILTGQLSQSAVGRLAQGFYLAALGVWLLLQLYVLPFLFEQETPSVRLALRNGAAMLGANLRFSVTLGLLLVCVLLLGTLLFLISIAAGSIFLALAGNHAVLNRLEAHRAAAQGGGT
jgi:uncharacterized membrane protein YesL